MHFKRDCPHAYQYQNKEASALESAASSNDAEAFKVNDYSHEEKEVLMTEAAHAAVLDSACTKTVTGHVWKDTYLASLNAEEKKQVRFLPGGTNFKFGGGNTIKSRERMEFPCVIAGQKTVITADVVDSDIPLLLSKPDMKRLGFKLNMTDDVLEVNGNKMDLDTTSSGHYYIPLKDCEVKVEKVHMVIQQETYEGKQKMVKKLHRQFAHPTAKSLKAIMKNADVLDEECDTLVDDVSKKCDVCKRYKKTPARPVVCLPLAKQFNDVVAMDLKQYGDVYFLHFIDLFTRFSKSKVIRRKTPRLVVDSIATEWIAAGFGPPKKFLVDNGGEFDNAEYRELAEQFNVEVCATAAYSPWSNGICERNHYVVDMCVQKIMEEDPKIALDVALAWAVNAKNSMQNHCGFSPIQLVLGKHPNLPSVMVNKLPAMEDAEVSESVMKHLNTLHAARRAFAKAESSERIRRALRHNVRVAETAFQNGEKVFYKRDDSNRWRGPGKVIGQDGKIVFIRHGSQLERVATCRAIKIEPNVKSKETQLDELKTNQNIGNIEKGGDPHRKMECGEGYDEEDDDDDDEVHDEGNGSIEDEQEVSDMGTLSEEVSEDNSYLLPTAGSEGVEQRNMPEKSQVPIPRKQTENTARKTIVKVNDKIKYRLKDNEEWIDARVISKGGKATGKNKYYVNVQNDKDSQKLGVHLDKVEFEIVPDTSRVEEDGNNCEDNSEESNVVFVPMNHHGQPEVVKAKQQELQNWSNFEVYTEVPDRGQRTLSTRWVVTEKSLPDGHKGVKARLVVRGFEEEEKVQSDSPTAAKSTLRMVMAIAASEEWKCESIDIKAAFLQGKKIEREVYLTPPPEVKEDGIIWRLDKTAYGLDDASRNWYFSVRDELIKLGCKQSELDKALFSWYSNGKLEGVFVMHVDDFLFAGTQTFNTVVIDPIVNKYQVGKRQIDTFRYVGLHVSQSKNNITVNQDEYGAELEEIPITSTRRSDISSPLTKHETQNLRATAGQLNWMATQTRPDISYDALELNMTRNHPTVAQLVRANKAVRQAKRAKGGVCFPKLGPFSSWKMEVFCDASWGNLPDGVSSAEGYVIFLTGQDQKCCPLAWTSNKIKRKVSSTLAAEALSMQDALDHALYLGSVLTEIYCNTYVENKLPVVVYTDNKSLHQNVHSTKQVHEKRLRINIAEIQRMLAVGEVQMIEWLPSKLQLADCLTKRGTDSDWLLECFNSGELKIKCVEE